MNDESVSAAPLETSTGTVPPTWFDDHWPWVIGGAFVLALAIYFISQTGRKRRGKP